MLIVLTKTIQQWQERYNIVNAHGTLRPLTLAYGLYSPDIFDNYECPLGRMNCDNAGVKWHSYRNC